MGWTKIEIVCAHCGSKALVNKRGRSTSKYCNRQCYYAAVKSAPTEFNRIGRDKGKWYTAVCEYCGHNFETKQSLHRKYCSSACFVTSNAYHGKGIRPAYNKAACRWFDQLNELTGWNGIHAENEGEHTIWKDPDNPNHRHGWYSLDYYCSEHKLIIEWDEKYHTKPCHQKHLQERLQFIRQQLPDHQLVIIQEGSEQDYMQQLIDQL